METTVKTIMTQEVIALKPTDLLDTAIKTMKKHKIRHIPIVGKGTQFLGLLTHRDLLAASASYLSPNYAKNRDEIMSTITVEKLMQKRVRTTIPDADLREVARVMKKNKWGCLPVLDGDRLVGIVTASDFLTLSINLLTIHNKLKSTMDSTESK